MADFASNVPVSRPRKTGWEVSWDCNGMVWSNDFGLFYEPVDEIIPIRPPSRVVSRST